MLLQNYRNKFLEAAIAHLDLVEQAEDMSSTKIPSYLRGKVMNVNCHWYFGNLIDLNLPYYY